MSVVKELRFPVTVEPAGEGPRVRTAVPGKRDLLVATPPDFPGGLPGYWSPEDLFVGAVASCFAVTLKAVAKRRGIPIHRLDVRGLGHVGSPAEGGGLQFTLVELDEREREEARPSSALHLSHA